MLNPHKSKKNKDQQSQEKERDSIIIKLAKKGEEYVYLSDNLQESSKIKLPLPVDSIKDKEKKGFGRGRHALGGSHSNPSNIITLPADSNDYDHDPEIDNEVNLIKNQIEKIKNQPVMIPTCTQWFEIEKIHEIEMNSLPEFFCGKYPSKTPQTYKEYRNFIVSLYRENPNCYLSATGKNIIIILSFYK